MTSIKIKKYETDYGITLKETNDFDQTYLQKNLEYGEYLILDSSTLHNDNPFKQLENINIDIDLKEIINDIAIYHENTGSNTKVINSFGKNIPHIYFYKKTDSNELYNKLDIKKESDSREYSNYLRSFIIYDRCLEFINSLDDTLYFKAELLKLYQNNKKQIIKGSAIYGPSRFVLILWDIIAIFAKIENEYLSLLKTSYNITSNYKPDLDFNDIKTTINTIRLPFKNKTSFRKSSSSVKGNSLGLNIASQAVQKFKEKIKREIINLGLLIVEINDIIFSDDNPKEEDIKRRFNKLNQAARKNVEIIKSIEDGSEEIKATFASDLPPLKKLLSEINENIEPISQNYPELFLSTPTTSLAFNITPPATFQARRNMFELASRKETPGQRLRRASHAIVTSLNGLKVFNS
jgi:hypothetical protein